MQTMKELLDAEFFPTDDEGRQLVANALGDVTIVASDMPGEYPILGVGPYGYAVQFDENGRVRQDTPYYNDHARVVAFKDSADLNSLTLPDVTRIVQFTVVEPDGTVVCCYDTREEAECAVAPGEQIVELDGYGYVREITEWTGDDMQAASSAECQFGGYHKPLGLGSIFGG